MAGFSAGEAISSGFRLIGRRPGALIWWIGAWLVLAGLPMALMVWAVLPDFANFIEQTERHAREGAPRPDLAAMMALQSRMLTLQSVGFLSGLVSHSVLLGAIYRAVLHPDERRFGYLRLSGREVWLGLMLAVLYVGLWIALFVVLLPTLIAAAIGAAAAERAGSAGLVPLICVALLLGGLAVVCWLVARFSLALPISFDRRSFAIEDSWRLTRGAAWRIVGVGVAVVVIALVIEGVVFGAVAGVGIALLLHGAVSMPWVQRFDPDVVRRMLSWIALYVLASAIWIVPMYVILAAPLADIYRQLTAAEPQPA